MNGRILFSELERHIPVHVYTYIKLCESHKNIRLCNADHGEALSVKSTIILLKWLKEEYPMYAESVHPFLQTLTRKRQYSTTHRIEVAYKNEYKCTMCDQILPPTFEIDHIQELRDGGEDTFENLQALCPNCHAEKTRANTLKRHPVFQQHFQSKADSIQENAFLKFHRKEK